MYGPLLVIITLMYLSDLIWAQYVARWSPSSRAPLDKVGGNYRGPAWLSSQGHFFFCSDQTKQQGVSLAYIFRTPWLSFPFSACSLSTLSALSIYLPHTLCVCLHACPYMHVYCMHERNWESVSCKLFDSASNKREHGFSSFSVLNWAMSSTVLLVITNLVGRQKEREGEEQERKEVMKNS